MVRIFLIGSNSLWRAGIEAIVARHGDLSVAGHALTFSSLMADQRRVDPDIYLTSVQAVSLPVLRELRLLAGSIGRTPLLMLVGESGELDAEVSRLNFSIARTSQMAELHLVAAIRLVVSGNLLAERNLAARLLKPAICVTSEQKRDDMGRLTARQREVFECMTRGMSNEEIASTLCVAPSTIKSHVKEILAKLRLQSRLDAVIYKYESKSQGQQVSPQPVRKPPGQATDLHYQLMPRESR